MAGLFRSLSDFGVGFKDSLFHTRISYYLEQPLSSLFATPTDPLPENHFETLHDRLAYDIALLVHLGIFANETEDFPGAVFSNDYENYRGFVGLSSPEGIDPLYPTINACTFPGDEIARYYNVPTPEEYLSVALTPAFFHAHRLAHDPNLTTFAFSAYLSYLSLYEQREIRYVSANGTLLTAAIALPSSVRIFSARNTAIASKILLPDDMEYLELSGTRVDANIRLPRNLKGYAAARTATDSSLVVPSSVRDLDLYDCPADDHLELPPHLESFCAPRHYKGLHHLASSIKRLSIRGCSSFPFSSYQWPKSLEELELYDRCIDGNHQPLPENLQFLHIDPRLPHTDGDIPLCLRDHYKRAKRWFIHFEIPQVFSPVDKVHNPLSEAWYFVMCQEPLVSRTSKPLCVMPPVSDWWFLTDENGQRKEKNYSLYEDSSSRFFLEAFPFPSKEKSYPSLEELLSHFFPNANADVLEAVAKLGILAGKEVMETTSKIADESYTGVVFSTSIDGKRMYCKVSSDVRLIAREAQYLTDAWTHPLLRPITPRMLGVFELPDAAGLLTYGTENKGIVAQTDLDAYNALRRKIFFAYKKNHPEINASDPVLIDVFNRALAHMLLSTHQENPLYHVQASPLIVPFEILVQRASVTRNALFLDLQELQKIYETVTKKYDESHSFVLGKTLVHFDARPENIFSSPHRALRPIGDPAFARVGFPEYDLARLESKRDDAYVIPYLFFRANIAREVGGGHEDTFDQNTIAHIQDRVHALSFLFATRTLSSKLSRGVIDHATYYRDLAFCLKGAYVK